MNDVIVVGAGVFGATVARALKAQGRTVVVVDDRRPLSGTAASAFLMKDSWMKGMTRPDVDAAMALLDRVYGLQQLDFYVGAVGKEKVQRVARVRTEAVRETLDLNVARARIVEVVARDGYVEVKSADGVRREARMVVVAAGVWCRELMQVPTLNGRRGASWRAPVSVTRNVIRPFAPYRQMVLFQEGPQGAWLGDGLTIREENWTPERAEPSGRRLFSLLEEQVSGMLPAGQTDGIRPFAELQGKPCLLEQRAPGLWLATGGGKNGTVAAGWAAHTIAEGTK